MDYDTVTTASLLMEIGALDSLDYFTNSKLRCLFATEDSKAESLEALAALLASNGFKMSDTDIRPYSGCSKVDSAKVLREFLRDKAPNVKFVLHRDRDYMDDGLAANFETEIASIDAFPFLTDLSDVENYFLNADHIAALNPGITSTRAQELIDEATTSTRDKSTTKLINLRTEAAIKAQKNGSAHDAGKLAIQAVTDYDANPVKWRRGKIVFNELTILLQKELKANPKLLGVSIHLQCPNLARARDAIWSSTGKAKPIPITVALAQKKKA